MFAYKTNNNIRDSWSKKAPTHPGGETGASIRRSTGTLILATSNTLIQYKEYKKKYKFDKNWATYSYSQADGWLTLWNGSSFLTRDKAGYWQMAKKNYLRKSQPQTKNKKKRH